MSPTAAFPKLQNWPLSALEHGRSARFALSCFKWISCSQTNTCFVPHLFAKATKIGINGFGRLGRMVFQVLAP